MGHRRPTALQMVRERASIASAPDRPLVFSNKTPVRILRLHLNNSREQTAIFAYRAWPTDRRSSAAGVQVSSVKMNLQTHASLFEAWNFRVGAPPLSLPSIPSTPPVLTSSTRSRAPHPKHRAPSRAP